MIYLSKSWIFINSPKINNTEIFNPLMESQYNENEMEENIEEEEKRFKITLTKSPFNERTINF